MKILGIIVVILGLAAGIFWFGWLRAPSPETVCNHYAELAKKEGKTWNDAMKEKCLKRAKKSDMEGLMPYAKKMKCRVAAKTFAEAEACRGK